MGFRHAWRVLVARPAASLVVMLTVAVVVGPSTAVLAVLNATVVRPLPFADPDRLLRVFTMPPDVTGVANRNPLGSLDFVRFRERLRSGEVAGQWARERTLGGNSDAEAESVPASAVSANFFRVLGAAPMRGRTFTEDEDRDKARLVVLSEALWRRRFGGDDGAIGRTLSIDSEDYVVIGVMPSDFNPMYVDADLWTPLTLSSTNIMLPQATYVQSVARMRPGVTRRDFDAELSTLMGDVNKEAPNTRGGWTVETDTVRGAQFGQTRPALLALVVAIFALALLAVANLTNVTVAEMANRRGELVLRAALGAGRLALLRGAMLESAMLAAGGGAIGLVLASWSLPAVLALDPTSATPFTHIAIDWRVQLVVWLLALVVGLAASAGPVLALVKGDIASGLSQSGRRNIGSRRSRRIRTGLVTVETVLAVVLLVASAVLLSAFERGAGTNPGFDPDHLIGGQLRLSPARYPTVEARAHFVSTLLERLRATPGIVGAGTTQNRLIPGFAFVTLVQIEGRPTPNGQPRTVQFRRASPGYFRTMRIPELRGRTFDDTDVSTSEPVAVVSQLFADACWPGEDPIGRRVQRGTDKDHPLTVIGVVGDVSDVGFGQAPAPTLYVAYAQNNIPTASIGLIVRTAGSPRQEVRTIARAIREIDPGLPLANITTLDEFLQDSLGPDRFRSVLLLVFAATGLLLAAVGIYGVTSRGVAERSREIGVRLALGGQPGSIRRLVLTQAGASVGAGFALGLPLAWLTARALAHWLPGVEGAPTTPAMAAVGLLAIAALVAAGVPALRAGRIDPVSALR